MFDNFDGFTSDTCLGEKKRLITKHGKRLVEMYMVQRFASNQVGSESKVKCVRSTYFFLQLIQQLTYLHFLDRNEHTVNTSNVNFQTKIIKNQSDC